MSFLNKVCSSLLPMLFHYNEDCNKLACTMGPQEEWPPVNVFVNITECCCCSVLFHFFTDCQNLNEFSTSESFQIDIQESCRILNIGEKKKKERRKWNIIHSFIIWSFHWMIAWQVHSRPHSFHYLAYLFHLHNSKLFLKNWKGLGVGLFLCIKAGLWGIW